MSLKILVVDDEPDVEMIFRQKFRRDIRKGEFAFEFAENGRVALQKIQSDPDIQIVFTDINMPVMNGLALLRELKQLDRPLLVPLIISAYDDMANIREAMNQGAHDFVTKPIDVDDLGLVLQKATGEIRKIREVLETAEKLKESERQKAIVEYSKALQKEFFDNITHELRTPLTLLLGPLDEALGASTDDRVLSHLQQAQRNGYLLLELINQLLDFAKIDADKMQLRLQPTELIQLLRDLAGAFEVISKEKSLDFRFESELESITVPADATKLSRILLNLLSNAMKFTPEGGQILLSVRTEADFVAISLSDSGPGIPEELLPRIFERFYQADTPTEARFQGTGIGLSLSRAMAEAHGGTLIAESPQGGGAEFLLRLPLKMREEADNVQLDAHEYEAAPAVIPVHLPSPVPDPTQDAKNQAEEEPEIPLILLVEDNAEMRAFTQNILLEKYRVIVAADGRQGLDLAREHIPDIVLSDWMMPEMDGIVLLEHVKHGRDTSHIPVVLLTAKAQGMAQAQGLKSGADAFLTKPFQPEALLAQLESILSQRDRLREKFKQDFLRPEKMVGASMEDQFVAEVKKLMDKNLGNENFGVERMADDMAMSRRTLGRKITALTGQSPVKFIRAYRLDCALQLLHKNAAPVWEVALKTGFGSSSYFTKCFKDHYGYSPREALENS